MSQPTTSAQDAGQPLTSYPPKPEGATHFQRDYGYQPATVIRWEWSTTFDRWCALVKFEDGSECFTWPKPYPHIPVTPTGWDTAGALAEDEQPAQPASAPLAHTPDSVIAMCSAAGMTLAGMRNALSPFGPELLDSLKTLLWIIDWHTEQGRFSPVAMDAKHISDARAAIARATLSTVG